MNQEQPLANGKGKNNITIQGISASPGITIGLALCVGKQEHQTRRRTIAKKLIEAEISRMQEAVDKTKVEINHVRQLIADKMGEKHAYIFDSHLLMLEDQMLIGETISIIRNERINAEFALGMVLSQLNNIFQSMEDEYLRERGADIRDIGRRLMKHLVETDEEDVTLSNLRKEAIIITHDLTPSDTAQMVKSKVLGFVTDIGGPTSHTAIMARSLEIPAVVGLKDITRRVQNGDELIIDGQQGLVIINPDEATKERYRVISKRLEQIDRDLEHLRELPAETRDGHLIEIAANIEFPSEVGSALEHGARGVGLYRTEFLYLNRDNMPSEEEQFVAYQKVAEATAPYPVIIRTLDLGGDKLVSYFDIGEEVNPFLGLRAIRLCLKHPEIFKVQLRAILRASVYGNLKIMFPMISGAEEMKQARSVLEEVQEELRQASIAFDEEIEVGAMIEIPSAALTADILAHVCDFFSLGTNDLIQYTLAVERANENIAYLYDPLHLANLRIIKQVIEAAHSHGIWVGMCGEMAGNPLFALLLLGMGLDELSMSAVSIPEMKKIIRAITLKDARATAHKALQMTSSAEIAEMTREKIANLIVEIF